MFMCLYEQVTQGKKDGIELFFFKMLFPRTPPNAFSTASLFSYLHNTPGYGIWQRSLRNVFFFFNYSLVLLPLLHDAWECCAEHTVGCILCGWMRAHKQRGKMIQQNL